ncbi:hypothetical protein K3163_03865 [Qipengyuania sp. 1NDW9]|uniref:Uncharacterized protein n=1 Tax=Qipengyuania xiapuensis TaxID=2867236 RepID=A0ABX9A0T2_9SPHN|nr:MULTISPECIES: hypothetical protein [Qipengyuania]MBX7492339.1 hypothetical protein [Qipengyuania xiapuensis]MBY6127997.1 hypothetical protein [Qipengyuania aquimaris]QZD93779.1 hypothetical protein K3162_05305 [Qipengyuania xiapuensis]
MEFLSETAIIAGVAIMTGGWIVNTWLRIKNGYPLENSWGKAVYPKNDQAVERVKLLTQENAELRAELGSLKDRLGNVERIVTDSGYHLTSEIDRLRDKSEAN